MANGCHLVTLRFDTALIDDVGHGGVVGEGVLPPRVPVGPAGTSWVFSSGSGSALAKLVCLAREAFLLVVSYFSSLALVLLIYMLVPRRSWSPALRHGLEP